MTQLEELKELAGNQILDLLEYAHLGADRALAAHTAQEALTAIAAYTIELAAATMANNLERKPHDQP